MDSPLADRGAEGVCTHGHRLDDGSWVNFGCQDQHDAWHLRRKLIAALERRRAGRGFTFATLDVEDTEAAWAAWCVLERVAARLGVTPGEWATALRLAGWDIDEEGKT